MNTILITGGTGLIGKYLVGKFIDLHYNVVILTRKPYKNMLAKVVQYNPEEKLLPKKAFENVNHIIHLAGANIASQRWTKKRKKEIIDSRVDLIVKLHDSILKYNCKIDSFTSASGINIYPYNKIAVYSEQDSKGTHFLAEVCKIWEQTAYDYFKLHLGIKTSCVRTAMVLSENGGALAKLNKLPFLMPIGRGTQYVPWIHIEDLFGIYHHIITSNLEGSFNAASNHIVTYHRFIKTLSKINSNRYLPKAIPDGILKLILGEQSEMVLNGSKVSSNKITAEGYVFKLQRIEDALKEIYKPK